MALVEYQQIFSLRRFYGWKSYFERIWIPATFWHSNLGFLLASSWYQWFLTLLYASLYQRNCRLFSLLFSCVIHIIHRYKTISSVVTFSNFRMFEFRIEIWIFEFGTRTCTRACSCILMTQHSNFKWWVINIQQQAGVFRRSKYILMTHRSNFQRWFINIQQSDLLRTCVFLWIRLRVLLLDLSIRASMLTFEHNERNTQPLRCMLMTHRLKVEQWIIKIYLERIYTRPACYCIFMTILCMFQVTWPPSSSYWCP